MQTHNQYHPMDIIVLVVGVDVEAEPIYIACELLLNIQVNIPKSAIVMTCVKSPGINRYYNLQ